MWDIVPLNLGTLFLTKVGKRCIERSPDMDAGEISGVPCIAWLLTNQKNGKKILVDAGPSSDPLRDSELHGKIERVEQQRLEYVLRQYKTLVSEIDTIILTHLHWDHMLGVLDIPKVKVIVQRRELSYAVAPLASERASYELNDPTTPPPFLRFLWRIEVVDGEVMWDEGIRLIPLPGHTPGSQGVYVSGSEQSFFIVGDLLDGYENYFQDTPTCLYSNLKEFQQSLSTVRQKEKNDHAIILPGHEEAVWDVLKIRRPE